MKRGGRTLHVQIASTKDRRVDRHVSDEPQRASNQIVEKCSSGTLKQNLLQQDDLELAKTIKIARSAETAVQEARILPQGTKENPNESRLTTCTPHADFQRNCSAVTDVVERTDTVLMNAAPSRPRAIPVKKLDTCKRSIARSLKLRIQKTCTNRGQPKKKRKLQP